MVTAPTIHETVKIRRKKHCPTLQDRFDRACSLLYTGYWRQGWREFDECMAIRIPHVDMPIPQWRGESLAGKSILFLHEQGFGDTIQFLRFLPRIKATGVKRLSLWCPQTLASLAASTGGVDQIFLGPDAPDPETGMYRCSGDIGDTDYWCPMMSIPRAIGLLPGDIPADVPYIHADPKLVECVAKLGNLKDSGWFNVGVTWSGTKAQPTAELKAFPLARYRDLAAIPGVRLFSLQVGYGSDQLGGQDFFVQDLGQYLKHFGHTAAVIECMDLMICCDSAVAHCSAALAKPTWVLRPRNGEWRFPGYGQSTPWYPTMRIFRQDVVDDWSAPFARIAAELRGTVR